MNKILLAAALAIALGTVSARSQSLPPAHECPPTTATGTTGSATGPDSNPTATPTAERGATLPNAAAPSTTAAPTPRDRKTAAEQSDCPQPPATAEAPKP